MPVSVSRRDFLQMSLAVGAAAMLPRGVLAAADAAPAFDHLALLSDVHVSGGLFSGMASRLSVAVNQVLALPQKPEKVLVCGDCAYLTGPTEDYREYVRRIQPLVAAGFPLHMTLGNHDNHDRFWAALPKEQPDAKIAIRRQSMVIKGLHANWFMLDSLNEDDRDIGELGATQLEWLSAELDSHADKPALIMLHHDPVRNGKAGSLKDVDKLFAITRPRRQVKAMFFGHTHIWDVAQDKSGIHLINLPATGYTLWWRSFLGWVDCKVYSDSATLKIHAINPGEKENGLGVALKWRSAK